MKKKVLMLNSGGFDSAVLFHELVLSRRHEVVSLFFDYGQSNAKEECSAVKSMCERHGHELMKLELPRFDWSGGAAVTGERPADWKAEYVEMRNLIFLSYAISIAEARGISEAYVALLHTDESGFKDAQPLFVRDLNRIAATCGVEIIAPFLRVGKHGLANLAWHHGLDNGHFFSCHYPKHGRHCGGCDKCREVAETLDRACETTPLKVLATNGFDEDDGDYREAYMGQRLSELKLFVNNVCHERCAHCFYDFGELAAPELTHDERVSAVAQAVAMGAGAVHICGKEPFATPGRVYALAAEIKATFPNVAVSVVTNGKSLHRQAGAIKESALDRIDMSVDGIGGTGGVRKARRGDVARSLEALADIGRAGKGCRMMVAAHPGNKDGVKESIDFALSLGIEDFFVAMVRPLGRGARMDRLKDYEVGELFKRLMGIGHGNIEFFVNREYVEPYLKSGGFPCHPHEEYLNCYRTGADRVAVTDCLTLRAEFHCDAFGASATVTADGYAAGCTAGLGRGGAGNVRDEGLAALVARGRACVLKKSARRHCQTG